MYDGDIRIIVLKFTHHQSKTKIDIFLCLFTERFCDFLSVVVFRLYVNLSKEIDVK